ARRRGDEVLASLLGEDAGRHGAGRFRRQDCLEAGVPAESPEHVGLAHAKSLRQAVERLSTLKPVPSYRPSAPLGSSASTPSAADVIPRSRSARSDTAISAVARPRRRHWRRVKTLLSQPRWMPSAACSAGSIALMMPPATSSAPNATVQTPR